MRGGATRVRGASPPSEFEARPIYPDATVRGISLFQVRHAHTHTRTDFDHGMALGGRPGGRCKGTSRV
eukprot:5070297-Prymnesium_polylepis.4